MLRLSIGSKLLLKSCRHELERIHYFNHDSVALYASEKRSRYRSYWRRPFCFNWNWRTFQHSNSFKNLRALMHKDPSIPLKLFRITWKGLLHPSGGGRYIWKAKECVEGLLLTPEVIDFGQQKMSTSHFISEKILLFGLIFIPFHAGHIRAVFQCN